MQREATLISGKLSLRYALEVLHLRKNAKKSREKCRIGSHNSHRSRSSLASTSSSTTKMRTAAEAAAAVEQADYEGLIAEEENEMKQSEAEKEKRRGHALTQYQRDVAIMSANKRVVVAKAKLKAIQESIVEGELGDPPNIPDMDITECLERTVAWVNTSSPLGKMSLHPQVTQGTLLRTDTPLGIGTPQAMETPLRRESLP